MNQKRILLAACFLGFLAVAFGAFGAHAWKAVLQNYGRADTFELAVRYQFYHACVLLFLGLYNKPSAALSAVFFITGIFLFSGSLYFLALTNSTPLVMVTPVGGIFLLLGWGYLVWWLLKN